MRALAQRNGNDVVQTPIQLAADIVNYYKPKGTILEPCCGEGNFLSVFPSKADWCEISKGRDFLELDGKKHWDWIITNPPYSKYREFLNKSMDVADNVVFFNLSMPLFTKLD